MARATRSPSKRNSGDPTQFALSSPGTDTLQRQSDLLISGTGVKNITMTLLGGNTVLFDDAITPIFLQGSLTIKGGIGDNIVSRQRT